MSRKLPKVFTLSEHFAPSDKPRDILWGGTDLSRDVRNQEVGNCWTYPSVNSFESSLIRLGLADRSIRGSEWSLTTLHANNFLRGFAIKTNPEDPKRYTIKDDGEFGGFGNYAIQYFSTGSDGALQLTTDKQARKVESLFKDVNLGLNEANKASKDYPTGWPKNRPLSESPLFPAPSQPRSFAYDQALVGSTRQQTKQLLKQDGIYGDIGFSVDNEALLGFQGFLDLPTGSQDAGDWISPASLRFREEASGHTVSLKALIRELADQSERYGITPAFLNTFFLGSEPGAQNGGGHAVAVLGWDDTYRNPSVDFTDKLIEGFQSRINKDQTLGKHQIRKLNTGLAGFKRFLSDNTITYTNAGERSKGAWLIQNSWGSDAPGLAYQYLPFDLAEPPSKRELTTLLTKQAQPDVIVASYTTTFHQADASGLFGPVEASSTAIVGSDIWNSSGQPWHGIAYRFQPQQDSIIAIGSYLQPSVLETLQDANGEVSYRYDPNLEVSQWLQATLWRASDLLDPNRAASIQPIARSRIETAFTGYQTVEFDQPVDLDSGEELIATLQLYGDAAATQPISNARLLSYTPNPEAVAERQRQLASPDFSNNPDDPNYYRHLPVPLLNPDPLRPLPQERFYGLNPEEGLNDLGKNGQVVSVNVIYTNPEVRTSEASSALIGSASTDQLVVNDDANQVNAGAGSDVVIADGNGNTIELGFGNDRLINGGRDNRIEAGAGDDTVLLRDGASGTSVMLEQGRDTLIAIDSQDDDLVISGGSGRDTYVFAEGKDQQFEGEATITDFNRRDRIILRGFDPEDLRIRQLPGQTPGLRLESNRFTLNLEGLDLPAKDSLLSDLIIN
jgi:hypothetical protein